ncbi:hypothetical protein EWM64_g8959 [Hericium alpestre]|uniref:GB1/RHD3-type G domain-containing protein n=1 Tax=Hericium alpestre TaxID=135208 RepID=A0A4Y9ZJY6_9AGAM|nr:hypothetical protein EWM64_g8959 [Hericium alpestre]
MTNGHRPTAKFGRTSDRVQIVNDEKQFTPELGAQIEKWGLRDAGFDYDIVAVFGSQSTGKSTLLNRLFGTNFDVMDESKRQQTTKGIWMCRGQDMNVMVMDVEGTDGRERGEDQDFERKSALFSLASSEVMIVNLWEHQVGLYQGANMGLLKTVFEVNLGLFGKKSQDASNQRTLLLFVIRDHIGTTPLANLQNTLTADINRIWESLSKPPELQDCQLSDYFDLSFTTLPHKVLAADKFEEEVQVLRKRFTNKAQEDYMFKPAYHKRIPADGVSFYMEGVWEQVQTNKDLDLPTQQELLAQFRCDEIASGALLEFNEQAKLQKRPVEAGKVVDGLGNIMRSWRAQALSRYDRDASRYHRGVYERKRADLLAALDSVLSPLFLAMTSGLQHALAMLAGLITPPIIFASALGLDGPTSAYMISASLIGCGILSLVQMSRIRLFGGYYLGTGLISVVGTSFATLSTANAIFDSMYKDGSCPMVTGADGSTTRGPCPEAYGKVLGTSMVACFLEIFMSFVPPRILQRVFPPMVTDARRWGSPEFIGLGFLSFVSILLTELFGSPFLKNVSIIVGLAVGCIVAGRGVYRREQHPGCACDHVLVIGVYGPAVLPMLAVYISLAMEAMGDITASAEVSRVDVEGEEFESRIQGGVLSDGIGGFFSALFTVTPLSIFAQNNGVIAITRCANRNAGRWCCAFLILFGVLGKISGVFLAIPNPVLGGVTTFLFASVAVSGLRVLAYTKYTRRDRFVLAAALSFGIGDLLQPTVFTHLFDGVQANSGLQGLFDSITIVLSTPFLMSGIVAVVLNLILPQEDAEEDEPVPEVVDIEDQKD